MKRKKLRTFMIVLLLCFVFYVPVSAATINLTYWYDGESVYIGHWTDPPMIYINNMDSSNSSFYFSTALASAKTQWSNALGIEMATTTVEGSGDILYYGGTAEQLNGEGFDIHDGILGHTDILRESDDNDTYYWGSQRRYGRIHLETQSCLVSMGLTASECKKTATHELGHSLGYAGHDLVSSTAVMKQGRSFSYTLTSRDKLHLQQVY